MKRKTRRSVEVFSMSFLDVVCCGFGAIILLLVISKTAEPTVLEQIRADLQNTISATRERVDGIRDEATALDRTLRQQRNALVSAEAAIAGLRSELAELQAAQEVAEQTAAAQQAIEGRLSLAQQELTEEMERLLGNQRRRPVDTPIGGIPVDSEYIIFIIDTSGSMFNYAWPLMLEKVAETLKIYPKVKGIQVMNDMGEYMFSQYAGKWIPDTAARRKSIMRRLETWNPFSNSSPVEGITTAIRTFYAPDKKISLYVFGDEFSTGTIQDVVRRVDSINRADARGRRRVRIHAVGFPVQLTRPEELQVTGIRFAALMRILCARNGGTFVGLSRHEP